MSDQFKTLGAYIVALSILMFAWSGERETASEENKKPRGRPGVVKSRASKSPQVIP